MYLQTLEGHINYGLTGGEKILQKQSNYANCLWEYSLKWSFLLLQVEGYSGYSTFLG